MNVTTRKILGLAGVATTVACMGLTTPAVGAPDDGLTRSRTSRTVHVRGELIPIYGTANYVVRGDLVGTWLYNSQPKPLHEASTLYAEAGTEIFNGCVAATGTAAAGMATIEVRCTPFSCTGRASTRAATSSRANASTRSQAARVPLSARAPCCT
jgi:hypothetical protein